MIVEGQLVDVHTRSIYPVRIKVEGERIQSIDRLESAPNIYICPGLVDAHVHIESSMLPPAEFGRIALTHGIIATVSDPHEIANVLGLEGVRYMIDEAKQTPLHIAYGAPSCVPATGFETAGACLGIAETEEMLGPMGLTYLAEMMNWPGVLHGNAEVLAKIVIAQKHGRPVDGHAPGLRGDDAATYAAAGISTDHECTTLDEALDKLACGMKILIREGSAARNLEALQSLVSSHPGQVMLCTDDSHPDTLLKGHINRLVERLLLKGHDLFDILEAAVLTPTAHYSLPIGMLKVGGRADFMLLDNLQTWQPKGVVIAGKTVVDDGACVLPYRQAPHINNIHKRTLSEADFRLAGKFWDSEKVPVISVEDGQIVTKFLEMAPKRNADGDIIADTDQDILFISVTNRYADAPPAVALVHGFGLTGGALASSVAHDSHNVIAVSTDKAGLAAATNAVLHAGGGLCAVDDGGIKTLPLPIAGLMSDKSAQEVALAYDHLTEKAKLLGCRLQAPFMTLSFLALLVIPELKLSDKGLFDGKAFRFITDHYTPASTV